MKVDVHHLAGLIEKQKKAEHDLYVAKMEFKNANANLRLAELELNRKTTDLDSYLGDIYKAQQPPLEPDVAVDEEFTDDR